MDLSELPRFTKLKWLKLGNWGQNAQLAVVGSLAGLKVLALPKMGIIDAQLAPLSNLELHFLDLSQNPITDAGLAFLPQVQCLTLCKTPVQTLAPLRERTDIQELDLRLCDQLSR